MEFAEILAPVILLFTWTFGLVGVFALLFTAIASVFLQLIDYFRFL